MITGTSWIGRSSSSPAIVEFLTARLEKRKLTDGAITSPKANAVIGFCNDQHTACTQINPALHLLTETQVWARALHTARTLFDRSTTATEHLNLTHACLKFISMQLTRGRTFASEDPIENAGHVRNIQGR
jgi:hypothetical protein